jgi:hypothetical protein
MSPEALSHKYTTPTVAEISPLEVIVVSSDMLEPTATSNVAEFKRLTPEEAALVGSIPLDPDHLTVKGIREAAERLHLDEAA